MEVDEKVMGPTAAIKQQYLMCKDTKLKIYDH